MKNFIEAQFVDIRQKTIYPARISWNQEGEIIAIEKIESAKNLYVMPGFVDAHIHIESTMLHPQNFAKIALKHGTIATVSDPHEIANVLGVQGVEKMIAYSQNLPIDIHYGVPSCVPAALGLENAGAVIDAEDVAYLFKKYDLKYLAEMMNFPGVIFEDEEVMKKIKIAKDKGKVIDGHAPLLSGEALTKYIHAGISTDHECSNLEEALEKLQLGMKIQIREGSAAKNYEALKELIPNYWEQLMLCSDDTHPYDLKKGHINLYVSRIIKDGFDLWKVLEMTCLNPVEHYALEHGTLQIGDWADFIVVKDLKDFECVSLYRKGELKTDEEIAVLDKEEIIPNHFELKSFSYEDFIQALPDMESQRKGEWSLIEVLEGQIITEKYILKAEVSIQEILAQNPEYAMLMVINRYESDLKLSMALVKGFGKMNGALASSVTHDCHNIIVLSRNLQLMYQAIQELIQVKGALVAVNGDGESAILPLPFGGLMSMSQIEEVDQQYQQLIQLVKAMQIDLTDPFMTLSFLALPVIPKLKLTDLGLFDVENWDFVEAFPAEV